MHMDHQTKGSGRITRVWILSLVITYIVAIVLKRVVFVDLVIKNKRSSISRTVPARHRICCRQYKVSFFQIFKVGLATTLCANETYTCIYVRV